MLTPFVAICLGALAAAPTDDEVEVETFPDGWTVEHHTVDHDGVPLHVAAVGEGDLVVCLHGFPDYWYSWRGVMERLQDDYRVAALDLRGYNRSGQPSELEAYAMPLLIGDVIAVCDAFGAKTITLVAHDWGAAIAWQVAMRHPDRIHRLVIESVPHPAGFSRTLATDEQQQADSQYARDFQKPDAHLGLTASGLASWVRDEAARTRYVEAFERSSFEGMLAYYKVNYPRSPAPGAAASPPPAPALPRIQCPVLIIHGLNDRALHASGHNDCWSWIDGPTTMLMVPGAGHFVHHDAAELVEETLVDWLLRTE